MESLKNKVPPTPGVTGAGMPDGVGSVGIWLAFSCRGGRVGYVGGSDARR